MKRNFKNLKDKHRRIRHVFEPDFNLRIHRSLSWLKRAEFDKNDFDASFIFYWISFNAMYSDYIFDSEDSEKKQFGLFFNKLISVDTSNDIYNLIWDSFPNAIRTLLNNKFVYGEYWRNFHDGDISEVYKNQIRKKIKIINNALKVNDTELVLETLFSQLYFLRNQVLHGGSTWNSKVNREQIRDCSNILASFIPLFIDLMMDNHRRDWGNILYPVINKT